VVELVEKALGLLPGLIEAFRQRATAPPAAQELQNHAHRLAKGDAAGPDQELLQVFVNDARERLAAIRAWVHAQDRALPEFAVDDEIVRALHTLRGSAALVNAQGIGGLAGELENYLNALSSARMRLPPPGLQLLADAEPQLGEWVERLARGSAAEPDLKPWHRRIAEVQAAVPAAAVESATALGNADQFANEAFTRLEAIERVMQAWGEHPDTDFHPRELQGLFLTLRGDAVTAQCAPLGRAADAFAQRLLEFGAGGGIPDAQFFREVAALIESMYCMLDDFREGKLDDDGITLTARIAHLGTAFGETVDVGEIPPVAEDEPAAAAAAEPAEAGPLAPTAEGMEAAAEEILEMPPVEAMETGVDPELMSIFLAEADELLEVLDREFATLERNPRAKEPLAELARALHTPKGGARMAGLESIGDVSHRLETLLEQVAQGGIARDAALHARLHHVMDGLYRMFEQVKRGETPDAEALLTELEGGGAPAPAAPAAAAPVVDPELLSIFITSATELLQNIDQLFDAWERAPHSSPILTQLTRAVHSLKGSANTAGYPAMGQVAHQIKQLLDRISEGRVTRDAALYGRLHNCMDALHAMLESIGRGEAADPAPALAELDGIAVAPEAPPARPMDVAAVAPVAPPVAPAPVPAPAAEPPAGFDPELVQIFTAEASELLELLESSLTAWQADASNEDALREAQRALHTLKGGARMAGIMAMGTVAHDMESRVEEVAERSGPVEAESLAALHSQLEQLQRMQDRLARGEYAALTSGTVPEPAVDARRAAPEPRVERYAEPPTPPALEAAAAPAAAAAAAEAAPKGPWEPALFWKPEELREGMAARQRETARVAVEQLDKMLNEAGEISIYRARLEQHNNALQFQINEVAGTIERVREHLRALDIETETQIAARGFSQGLELDRDQRADFDPLEMDRFSRMQELSRTLSESVGDLSALRQTMDDQLSEAGTLLMQQGRVNTEIQQGLMGTLMVPFSRQVQRLQRVVKQTAQDTGKQAEVKFDGIEQELDRNVLERMVAPLEHLLRNSVVHGIEAPGPRRQAGKPEAGTIGVTLRREGTQLAIEVRDDGQGLDYAAIRKTAVERGLMARDARLRDQEVAMFIFEAGFSTAKQVTQAAGRGVGMDVVAAEVKQLGGTLELSSEAGKGTRFLIRLPLTLALSQALLVGAGSEIYAIPLPTIESIVRVPRDKLDDYLREEGPPFTYGGQDYRVRSLATLLETPNYKMPGDVKTLPAVLVRLGEGLTGAERRVALAVDTLFGNREIVSKAVGPQVSAVQGVSGGTILPDGRVVLILDAPALVTNRARRIAVEAALPEEVAAAPLADERQTVMVVDDSITIRRVTERLLERAGYRVVLAKDGLDAMAQLQTEMPATMLLDIEMPRADGFEVATFVRNNDRLKGVPIIMITSRSGEKHRERARQIGVNRYLIKPYQEEQLIGEVRAMLRGDA
jgi:chemosensory pili system protein ChpA (sensor histidine kinase/response regulator)